MSKKYTKNRIIAVRLDHASYVRLHTIALESDLYTQSRIMRGALLALNRLSKREREACIKLAEQGSPYEL